MLSIKDLQCSLPYIPRLISNCRQKMILDRYSDGNFLFEFKYLKLKSVLHLTIYLQHMSLIFLSFLCLCIGLSLISLKFSVMFKRGHNANISQCLFIRLFYLVWMNGNDNFLSKRCSQCMVTHYFEILAGYYKVYKQKNI